LGGFKNGIATSPDVAAKTGNFAGKIENGMALAML
jgi:hypothetical protein